MYVTLRVNGNEDALFVVDTGCTFTLLDNSLASELGKPLGKMNVHDNSTGQGKKVKYYKAPELFLGDTRLLSDSVVLTDDLTVIREASGHPIMGILGLDCPQNYCLQLDFDAGKLRFLDPDATAEADLGKAFALKISDAGFAVGENFLGVPEFDTIIDTGTTGSGSLQAALRKHAPGGGGAMVTNGHMGTITGIHAERANRFTNCVLGGEVYDLVLGDGYSSAIGLRFLARHQVTLDFPKMKMYLKRRANTQAADESGMSGFSSLRKDGETVVFDVEAGGPAELAGIRVGDKLVDLNGTPANTLEMWEIGGLFKSGDGKEVRLTLLRGDQTIQTKLVLKRRI